MLRRGLETAEPCLLWGEALETSLLLLLLLYPELRLGLEACRLRHKSVLKLIWSHKSGLLWLERLLESSARHLRTLLRQACQLRL